MDEPDKGTYMGLKNLSEPQWNEGYDFGRWTEDDDDRDDWLTINSNIKTMLGRMGPGDMFQDEVAWWSGYGLGWVDRDEDGY